MRGDFDLECCFAMSLWSTEPHSNGLLISSFIYGLSNEPIVNEHVKFEFEGFQFDIVITVGHSVDNAILGILAFSFASNKIHVLTH